MFDAEREEGANQILMLARRVAAELGDATGSESRVVGWIGGDGKGGWEYAVEFDGAGANLEVGDAHLLTFPHDERVRREVEERIRYQMGSGLEMAAQSSPDDR